MENELAEIINAVEKQFKDMILPSSNIISSVNIAEAAYTMGKSQEIKDKYEHTNIYIPLREDDAGMTMPLPHHGMSTGHQQLKSGLIVEDHVVSDAKTYGKPYTAPAQVMKFSFTAW